MATLIIDIETRAEDWKQLPGITRAALTHRIDQASISNDEKNRRLDELRSKTALSPFTAQIVSLSVYDVERKSGAVYFVSNTPDESFEIDGFICKQRTEKEILEDFWEGVKDYDVFVTFNGRAFTFPFIYHRSVALDVKPTADIARQRYLSKQHLPYHVDLMDEFSFYGAMQHRPSLQLLCGAYSIENPSVLGGEEIAAAFAEERYRIIAEKSVGDVQAMIKLYDKWLEYLAPSSFKNSVL